MYMYSLSISKGQFRKLPLLPVIMDSKMAFEMANTSIA